MNEFSELRHQWRRLCTGLESPTDVSSALGAWSRECSPLADIALADVPALLRHDDPDDQALRYLVTRAQHRDLIAHRAVFETFQPLLRQPRGAGEVAELLGAAWELIWQAPTNPEVRLHTWLHMRTKFLGSSRADKLTPQTREVPMSSVNDPNHSALDVEPLELLHLRDTLTSGDPHHELLFEDLLRDLPEIDRALLRSRFVDGLDAAEAGRRVGLSYAAATKRQNRALTKLRRTAAEFVTA